MRSTLFYWHGGFMNTSRRLYSWGLIIALSAVALFNVGCESDEERKIAAARTCLDGATSTTVETCTAIVEGLTSSQSYLIRCAAHYIYNGFTITSFANAFQKIKDNPSSGNNSMVSTLAFLAFPSNSGTHGATILQSDCAASGSKGMQRLSLMTAVATTFSSVAGITNVTTEAQMVSAITNFVSNGGSPTTLGNLAISAQSQFCNEGSSFATNDVCKTLNAAVGSSTPAEIGQALITQLQQNPP